MELQVIRRYLDIFDSMLRYVLLQRMSLVPLIGETKLKQGLPVFHPDREQQIYSSLEDFCNKTGLNPALLTNVYKLIINDAHRIQHEIISGEKTCNVQEDVAADLDKLMPLFEQLNELSAKFLSVMNQTLQEMSNQDLVAKDIINAFTSLYKDKILNN